MAIKTFHLNTEPHEVHVGEYTFLFRPEANGAEFATAYASLSGIQASLPKGEKDNVSAESLKAVSGALVDFLHAFMLPESVKVFDAATLPDRVLVGMVEFLAETYAGGNDPSGSSSES